MQKIFFLAAGLACMALALLAALFYFNAKSPSAAKAEALGFAAPGLSVAAAGEGFEERSGSSAVYPSFALEPNEIALQTVSADINLDGTNDQLCAIRRAAEAEIYIVCAIQNPLTREYTRLPAVKTNVTQAQTLIMHCADVTGRHENALVYSGMNARLQYLGIFLIEKDSSAAAGIRLREIFNLPADAAIYIEETRRTEAYRLGLAQGDAYPVISYHSIQGENGAQLQRTYSWNPQSGVYELASESRVSTETAAAAVARELQEGGGQAFSKFTKGIWYKSGEAASGMQIAFDPDAREIVFLDGQAQEVFEVESVSTRRYGVQLAAHNSLIPTIRRLVDIEIAGQDEMQISATDDVGLRIGIDSLWNGSYRRLQNRAGAEPLSSAQRIAQLLESADSGWKDASGRAWLFSGGILITESADGRKEKGKYALYMAQGNPVMQVKASSGENTFYLLSEGAEGQIVMQEATASSAGLKAKGAREIALAQQ